MTKDRFMFRAWNIKEKEYVWDAEDTYDNGCSGLGSLNHDCFGFGEEEIVDNDPKDCRC